MRLLVAHPSPDVYGSDLQLVETVRGLHQAGQQVTVVVPFGKNEPDAGEHVTVPQVPIVVGAG